MIRMTPIPPPGDLGYIAAFYSFLPSIKGANEEKVEPESTQSFKILDR
jgi:hypothetical protein